VNQIEDRISEYKVDALKQSGKEKGKKKQKLLMEHARPLGHY
jgi:hypothetical protein